MQRTNHSYIELGDGTQKCLHLHTILPDDTDVITPRLFDPRFIRAGSAEFPKGICRKQDFFRFLIGHHDFRPMHHRSENKMKHMRTDGEGIAVCDHVFSALKCQRREEIRHHGERLGIRDNHRLRILGQESCQTAGMIRLHVLYDEIVRRGAV